MTKVWYCATCGFEVDFRGRCHGCGQRLELSPLRELEVGPEDEEVGYRLDDWADDARGQLIVELVSGGVAHRFEDDELVVAVESEETVDELVTRLTGAEIGEDGEAGDDHDDDNDELDGDPEAGDGVTAGVIQLERAAERLSVDPTDMEADAQVAEVSAAVFMVDDPSWVDPDSWAAVGRVTRRLMAALNSDDAMEEEIRAQAGILARLLHPLVHPARPRESLDLGPPQANGSAAPLPVATPSTDNGGSGATPSDAAESDGAGESAEQPMPTGAPGRRSDTVYELGEWLPEQRAELAMLLDRQSIAHAWDGEDLVVASEHEGDVEAVLDRIEAVEDPDADEEATYRALEELFAATDRLVGSPSDPSRGKEVVRAVIVADGPIPLGLDDAHWFQIRQRARILADSVEHKAPTEVVLAEAKTLRELLRGLV